MSMIGASDNASRPVQTPAASSLWVTKFFGRETADGEEGREFKELTRGEGPTCGDVAAGGEDTVLDVSEARVPRGSVDNDGGATLCTFEA